MDKTQDDLNIIKTLKTIEKLKAGLAAVIN